MKVWKYYHNNKSVDLETFFNELSKVTSKPQSTLDHLRTHRSTKYYIDTKTGYLNSFKVDRVLEIHLKGI